MDLIFPQRCPVCDKIVMPRGGEICPDCEKSLKVVGNSYCVKCGKPMKMERKDRCNDCRNREHSFDLCRSAFVYNDAMRKSIYRLKYNGRREYASYLGRRMAEELSDVIHANHPDAIIPVPMYKRKEKKRGYNQAYLLAKMLSEYTNIPVRTDVVIRCRNTKIMRSLSARERENNLKKAFKIVGDSVKLTNIVLVDDIYTTGSTADAVARVLKAAGVERVLVASLSTGIIDG